MFTVTRSPISKSGEHNSIGVRELYGQSGVRGLSGFECRLERVGGAWSGAVVGEQGRVEDLSILADEGQGHARRLGGEHGEPAVVVRELLRGGIAAGHALGASGSQGVLLAATVTADYVVCSVELNVLCGSKYKINISGLQSTLEETITALTLR